MSFLDPQTGFRSLLSGAQEVSYPWMNSMRHFWLLAILAFAAAKGCSNEAERMETSIWWAPLVTYADSDSEIMPKLTILLADRGIDTLYIGGHGQRHWVPIEKHQDAVALLRAVPYAAKLRIHTIEGGPRQNSKLPRVGPGDREDWKISATFKKGEITAVEVISLLNLADCEAGLVTFGTHPQRTSIFVPPGQESAARKALSSSALADRLRFDR